ncbi:MAG: hypothetical protein E7612_07685 [Ruminococcaceae bacterium]|nr:hypothetical protein [Oscillospiraceae bacterium]
MSRRRSTTAKLIFSLFVMLAIYIGGLFGAKNHTRVFIALTTLAWHILANIYCSWISSYRFKNPATKYIKIKNKFIRKIFVRPCSVGGIEFADKSDDRINIIGLILNILNTLLLVSFEVLIFMPSIPCETYHFTFVVGTRPRNYTYLGIELHSFNEIIPAEASRAFAVATALILLVFVGLFEHQLKEHRRKYARNTAKTPRKKPFKKTAWYHPLYVSLIGISVRQNNKKLKFWYNKNQLEQIETLVKSASPNAELRLETKGNAIISFTVVDTLNNSVRFKGLFI